MPYIGQRPSKGDENNFKILDDISSYTLTFDGSDSSVVSAANDTITSLTHRFAQGQRVTYNKGGGTVITGLSDGVYYIIKEDHNTIKLATSASNATNGVAVNITGVGAGSSHTLNVAFDGVNTKFKATHTNGQKAKITRSAQLVISMNGVIQQPHDTATPSTGFGFDLDGTIVFSQAPVSTDIFWAHVLTNNNVTFDISDNDIDNFTGDGSTTEFNLSKSPPDNRNVLVTIDGVVQYPNDPDGTARAYVVVENVLTFNSAPASGVEIQVRHIGFAGATSGGGGVTNFYGRTGAVVLKSTDNITINDAAITGNATVTGNLTVNGNTTTLDTNLIDVDKIEVTTTGSGAVAVAVTHNGSPGDLIRLYDGAVQQVTIDDTGKVGLGTITPRTILHLHDSASTRIQITDDAMGAGAGDGVILGLNGDDDFFINNRESGKGIKFFTGSDDLRFHIDNGGRIGIGIDNPSDYFASYNRVVMGRPNDSGSMTIVSAPTYGGYIAFADGTSGNQAYRGLITYAHGQDAMVFNTAATERLRIRNDGRVGINTTNPNALLDVYQDGTGTVVDTIMTRTSGGGGFGIQCSNVAAANPVWALRTYSAEDLVLSPGGHADAHEKVRIKASNGYVGIATNNPQDLLHIQGSSDTTLRFTGNQVKFYRESGSSFIDQYGAGDISFRTTSSNIERLRIKSDGKFGVGDFTSGTAVSQAFHVKGSQPAIYLEHTGGYDMTLTTNDGMGQNGITVNGGFLSLAYNNKNIVMCRTGGSVGINSTSPGAALEVNGGTSYDVAIFNSYHADGPLIPIQRSGNNIGFLGSGKNLAPSTGGADDLALRSQANLIFTAGGGTEQLRINSSGTLLVKGNANPNAVFDRGSANTTNVNLNYNGTLTGQLGAANQEFQLSAAGASTPMAFYVNGDKRLEIQSTGIVKVETSDSSSFNAHFLVNNSESNSGVSLIGSGSSFSAGGWAAVTDAAIIRSSANSSNGLVLQAASGDMRFYVGGNPPAERLRITSDGKVGINSTSPTNTLVVREPTDNNSSIQLFRASTGGDIASINWATNQGNQAKINYRGASPAGMQFYTGGTASSNLNMIIDTSGNVGIGTDSPVTDLDVRGSSDASITIGLNNGTKYGNFSCDNSATYLYAYNGNDIIFSTHSGNSFNRKVTIKNDGKVGINESAPSEKLQIDGDILLGGQANSSESNYAIKFEYNNHQFAKIVGDGRDSSGYGDIDFYTSAGSGVSNLTQRMSIRADGKIGIGNFLSANPATALHINYDSNNLLTLDNSTAGTQKMFFAQNGGTHALLYATSSTGALTLESDPDNNHNNSSMNFTVDGGERLHISDNGQFYFYGTDAVENDAVSTIYITDTASYNAIPQGGITFRHKYHSNGAYANMAGIVGKKENNQNGDFGSEMYFFTRTNGVAPTKRFSVGTEGVVRGMTGTSFSSSHGAKYSNTYSTQGWGANIFQDVIPNATLVNGRTYLISFYWSHAGSGAPYILSGNFLFRPNYPNSTGTSGPTYRPFQTAHTTHGTSRYFEFAPFASGYTSSQGIRVQPVGWSIPNNNTAGNFIIYAAEIAWN